MIKKYFKFIILEFSSQKIFFSVFSFIIIIMYSITISTIILTMQLPTILYESIEELYKGDYSIMINGNIEEVYEKFSNEIVDFSVNLNSTFDNASIRYKDYNTVVNNGIAIAVNDMYKELSEFQFLNLSNSNNEIWLNYSLFKDLEVSYKDKIVLEINNVNHTFYFAGMYDDLPGNYIISLDSFNRILSGNIQGYATLSIYEPRTITEIVDFLIKNNFGYLDLSGIYETIKTVEYLSTILILIALLLVGISCFLTYLFMTMLINIRAKTYYLYKIIGLNSNQIIFIAFIPLFIVVLFSVLIASYLSMYINIYFMSLIESVFQVSYLFEFTLEWYVPFIIICINVIFLLSQYIYIRKKIVYNNIQALLVEE